MGIGLVLAFWAVVLVVLLAPAVSLLLWVGYLTGGIQRRNRVGRWVLGAVPLTVAYGLVAFLAYAAWCSLARGVDPGIGDWWGVPLDNGYSLTFIDVPDVASIHPRGATDGMALVAEITQIGEHGRYVYGSTRAEGSFLLDTETGALQHHLDRPRLDQLLATCCANPAMVEVSRFYLTKRWGLQDVIAAGLLSGPAAALTLASFLRAWFGRAPGRRTRG